MGQCLLYQVKLCLVNPVTPAGQPHFRWRLKCFYGNVTAWPMSGNISIPEHSTPIHKNTFKHCSYVWFQAWQRSLSTVAMLTSRQADPLLSEQDARRLWQLRGGYEKGGGGIQLTVTAVSCGKKWVAVTLICKSTTRKAVLESHANTKEWESYLCFAGLQLFLPLFVFHCGGPCG